MLPQYTDHHMLLEDDAFLLLEELKRTKDGKIEQLSREKQRLAYGARPSPWHPDTHPHTHPHTHTHTGVDRRSAGLGRGRRGGGGGGHA